MNYVILYFEIGLIAFLLFLVIRSPWIWKETIQSNLVDNTWKRELAVLLTTSFSGFFFLWPFIIPLIAYFMVSELLSSKEVLPPEPAFRPQISDLKSQTTLEEIEKNEIVSDPNGAVPQVAFGHLNDQWQKFRGRVSADCTVYSFQSRLNEQRSGYVALRKGVIIAFFQSEIFWNEP
jgi:hypothetical protein